MARRRGSKVAVYVEIGASKLKYGFLTQQAVHNEVKTVFGQTTYTGAAGVFFGANSPKPPKATIVKSTGNVSSFCSTAKVKTLLQNRSEYDVSQRSTIRSIGRTGKTTAVMVDMPGGYKYAWRLTNSEADLIAELGVELATASGDLVWGSTPKPPRAYKRTAEGLVSTFCKPQQSAIDAAIAKGWSISGVDYDLIPNAP